MANGPFLSSNSLLGKIIRHNFAEQNEVKPEAKSTKKVLSFHVLFKRTIIHQPAQKLSFDLKHQHATNHFFSLHFVSHPLEILTEMNSIVKWSQMLVVSHTLLSTYIETIHSISLTEQCPCIKTFHSVKHVTCNREAPKFRTEGSILHLTSKTCKFVSSNQRSRTVNILVNTWPRLDALLQKSEVAFYYDSKEKNSEIQS